MLNIFAFIFLLLSTIGLSNEKYGPCEQTPYEKIKDKETPPCDGITQGYYYEKGKCYQKNLGCYGVFPFSSKEECQKKCLRPN